MKVTCWCTKNYSATLTHFQHAQGYQLLSSQSEWSYGWWRLGCQPDLSVSHAILAIGLRTSSSWDQPQGIKFCKTWREPRALHLLVWVTISGRLLEHPSFVPFWDVAACWQSRCRGWQSRLNIRKPSGLDSGLPQPPLNISFLSSKGYAQI